MAERRVQVVNKLGLHARPSSLLVETASRFGECEIKVKKEGDKNWVKAKEIMDVLMLACELSGFLIFSATGPGEEEALDALEKLVKAKFYEE